jgi:hypothetical protein
MKKLLDLLCFCRRKRHVKKGERRIFCINEAMEILIQNVTAKDEDMLKCAPVFS